MALEAEVEEDHVRLGLPHLLHRLVHVGGGRQHLEPGLGADQRRDAFPQEPVVVNENERDRAGLRGSRSELRRAPGLGLAGCLARRLPFHGVTVGALLDDEMATWLELAVAIEAHVGYSPALYTARLEARAGAVHPKETHGTAPDPPDHAGPAHLRLRAQQGHQPQLPHRLSPLPPRGDVRSPPFRDPGRAVCLLPPAARGAARMGSLGW